MMCEAFFVAVSLGTVVGAPPLPSIAAFASRRFPSLRFLPTQRPLLLVRATTNECGTLVL